jgi:outer membrane protein
MRAKHGSARRAAAPILTLAVLAVLLPSTAAAADPRPFGVIDSQRIVEDYEAARDAQAQYEKFLRDLEREVAEKERELQGLMEEIDSQKMLLSQERLGQKTQQFETKRAEYFEFRKQIDVRAETEYKAKIGPIIEQVRLIAERLGKEKGFGIIVDTAALTVLYLDGSVDLTNDVLQALAKGHKK